jgi:hypothetical protein
MQIEKISSSDTHRTPANLFDTCKTESSMQNCMFFSAILHGAVLCEAYHA